jgi:hypothetical protein
VASRVPDEGDALVVDVADGGHPMVDPALEQLGPRLVREREDDE